MSDFFKRVVDAIIRKLPVSRQILLYSATFPQSVIVSLTLKGKALKPLSSRNLYHFVEENLLYKIGLCFMLKFGPEREINANLGIHERAHEKPVRDQSDGGVDT